MNDSAQRKSGVILSYVSILINTVIQLLYTPLLIRMLGQSEYGLYSLVSSIIGYLTVLDLGFGNAIIVYTAKYKAQNMKEQEQKLHGMFKVVFIIIGIIAATLGVILYFFVGNIFGNTMTEIEIKKMKIMMLILSLNLMMTFSFSIYSSIISAYEKFTYQKIIAIIGLILKPIIMIPLLFMGFKSIAMSIVITIVNIIVLLSNYLYCKNKLNVNTKFLGFDKIIFKIVLGYSIWIFLGTIVDKVNWSVDNFVLGAVSGTVAVSIYSVATQINSLFINLSTALSSVFLPKMSKLIAKNTTNDIINNEFIKIGRLQFYIVFLFLSGFILFGKMFIKLWVGENFIESYYVTLCLICPAFIPLIQNLGLSIMQAMNRFKFKAISTFIMSIFNVIISVLLAKKYGATGAAFGTTISIVIVNIIVMNIYYYKVLKINIFEFWKNIFAMFIKYLIPIFIIIFLEKLINISNIYIIVILGCFYVSIYILITYFLVINKYEKDLINSIIKKIRRK